MSTHSLTVAQLFEALSQRLDLVWVAGQAGAERRIDQPERASRRPSLVGYLNLIHASRVQIIGGEELKFLDGLSPPERKATLSRVARARPPVLLVSRGFEVPEDIQALAERHKIPLWRSSRRGHELLTYLQYHLARALAPRTLLHGVMMEVYSIGVLITGASGVGKSELALELVTRGHRLVADDCPEFTRVAPDVIDATCPENIRDMLEVRGLGLLNIREMFGDTAVKPNKYLRLILHLTPQLGDDQTSPDARLHGDFSLRRILEVDIPQLTIPVGPGRNLAVLTEAAVRNFALKNKGMDAAKTFIDRQAHQLRRDLRWSR